MIPTIGRIVHFWPERATSELPSRPIAAIITAVHTDTIVSLTIFPFGQQPEPVSSVPLRVDESHSHSWSWPERVG